MTSNDDQPDKDSKHHLRRLDQIWVDPPLYFITTGTANRAPLLADQRCTDILLSEWTSATTRHGWSIGCYVIMPDHVHFFASPSRSAVSLSRFMQAWKEWTSKKICEVLQMQPPLWQSEFFDHVLRSFESYEEKSRYILENPVRAGLVKRAEDWPYHGKLADLNFGS